MFIGVIFLIVGLSILLNACFGFHLPIFRTLIAIFFIYVGTQILFGTFWKLPSFMGLSNSAMFSNLDIKPMSETGIQDSSILFGKIVIDLTAIKTPSKTTKMTVNTLFGEAEVLLDQASPVYIHSNAAFGEARMPNDNRVAFGSLNYRSTPSDNNIPCIELYGNVMFGSLRFRVKK